MEDQRCETCKFFLMKGQGYNHNPPVPGTFGSGVFHAPRCRRHPPPNQPVVEPDDWCGEYQPTPAAGPRVREEGESQ